MSRFDLNRHIKVERDSDSDISWETEDNSRTHNPDFTLAKLRTQCLTLAKYRTTVVAKCRPLTLAQHTTKQS